jgi:hypothetical protein
MSFVAARLGSHQLWTNAAAAVRTWHTVTSGFFFPQLQLHPRQE